MAPVKLYTYYVSQPARACIWAVLANNATDKVDIISVDMAKGEHRNPAFLVLNPYHTIPVLRDEDTGVILYESGAILQYLAEKFNWSSVTIPKDDIVARAKAINYLHFHHGHARAQLGKEVCMYPHMQAFTELSFYVDNKHGLALYSFDKYPNIHAWLQKMTLVEGYEKAFEGISEFVLRAKTLAGDA